MGLEFKSVCNQDISFIIPDSQLIYFETAYFNNFNEKYGSLIDRYGTFRLEINHLQYLETLLEKDRPKSDNAKELLIFIKKCINQNTVLKVFGN